MNKLTSDPRLPTVNDEKIRPLTQRLYELFRQFTNSINRLIEFEESAWISFNPTVTAATGSFTSVSATGNYLIRGKITHFSIKVTCTTLGTASDYVKISLPYSEQTGVFWTSIGKNLNNGKSLIGGISSGGSHIDVAYYDSTFPIGSGESFVITGFYDGA